MFVPKLFSAKSSAEVKKTNAVEILHPHWTHGGRHPTIGRHSFIICPARSAPVQRPHDTTCTGVHRSSTIIGRLHPRDAS
jgi:beta-lactamase regulating signal transducer with metallopeptidase domain